MTVLHNCSEDLSLSMIIAMIQVPKNRSIQQIPPKTKVSECYHINFKIASKNILYFLVTLLMKLRVF